MNVKQESEEDVPSKNKESQKTDEVETVEVEGENV